MFRGVNSMNLDAKGRFVMPNRYRDLLQQSSAGSVVVTVSPQERCLWLYPLTGWDDVERKVVALPSFDARSQRLKRMLIGHATDVDLDGTGRVLLSGPLREFAGLGKKIVVIGQGNKFEIWAEEAWSANRDVWMEDDFEDLPASAEISSLSL